MNPPRSAFAAVLLSAILPLGAATPAAADWLMLRGGEPVETAGPWEVDGRMVVFETPDGKLSSLQLALIDLEASERLTEERRAEKEERRRRAEEAEPEARRPSIARITDADIPSAPPVRSGVNAEQAAGAAGESGDSSTAADGLEIVDWEHGYTDRGNLWIRGDVRNSEEGVTAIRIALLIRVYDQEGVLITEERARVEPSALPPGGTASFEANFPDVYDFGVLKFDLSSGGLRTAPRDLAGAQDEQGTGRQPGSTPR